MSQAPPSARSGAVPRDDLRAAFAYINRGNAHYRKKEYDRAISDFNKAIEVNPNDADTYNNRGLAYYNNKEYYQVIAFKAGKAADGLPDAEKSLELNPNNARAIDTRANILEALGKRDEAIADFRHALSPWRE